MRPLETRCEEFTLFMLTSLASVLLPTKNLIPRLFRFAMKVILALRRLEESRFPDDETSPERYQLSRGLTAVSVPLLRLHPLLADLQTGQQLSLGCRDSLPPWLIVETKR